MYVPPKILLFCYYSVEEIIFRSDLSIYLPLRFFSSIFLVLKKYISYLICQSLYLETVILCFSTPDEINFLSDLFTVYPYNFQSPVSFMRDWNYLSIRSSHLSTPETLLFCYHCVDDISIRSVNLSTPETFLVC